MLLLLTQEQQEVARLLLMLKRKRIVEREKGIALAIGLRKRVGILFGRFGDKIERRGAEHSREGLKLADARAGTGRLNRPDIGAAGSDARSQIGLGKAISLALTLD